MCLPGSIISNNLTVMQAAATCRENKNGGVLHGEPGQLIWVQLASTRLTPEKKDAGTRTLLRSVAEAITPTSVEAALLLVAVPISAHAHCMYCWRSRHRTNPIHRSTPRCVLRRSGRKRGCPRKDQAQGAGNEGVLGGGWRWKPLAARPAALLSPCARRLPACAQYNRPALVWHQTLTRNGGQAGDHQRQASEPLQVPTYLTYLDFLSNVGRQRDPGAPCGRRLGKAELEPYRKRFGQFQHMPRSHQEEAFSTAQLSGRVTNYSILAGCRNLAPTWSHCTLQEPGPVSSR